MILIVVGLICFKYWDESMVSDCMVSFTFIWGIDDISFSEIGTYIVHVNVSGFPGSFVGTLVFIVPPEINFCNEAPGGDCSSGGGNQIFAKPQETNVIPVDAVIPIKVGVIDTLTGFLDSSYSGTIKVDKLIAPGEMNGI